MRLTAELLLQAEQRTNPDQDRELVLRDWGIPAIEHFGATKDDFDAIDLTNNRLLRLENFPRLRRLSNLLCAENLIESIDGKNLEKNVPNLKSLTLSYNNLSSLAQVATLGDSCRKLEFLSLVGNPVTQRQHYRLYTIHRIPTLKVLDFGKVTRTERERAERLAQSAAGAALESDVQVEARQQKAKTFVPGEGLDEDNSKSFVVANFTEEEKLQIRELLAEAKTAKEMEEIERSVRRGVLPPALQQNKKRPADSNKVSDEDDGQDAKRQKKD